MFRNSLSAILLALLAACSAKVNNLPGQCSTSADCPNGDAGREFCDVTSGIGVCVSSCGDRVCTLNQICLSNQCVAATCAPACTAGYQCEPLDGGYQCVQTDCIPACDLSYQTCNTGINPPACEQVTCHPQCPVNEQCLPEIDGGYGCVLPTTGSIKILQPDAGMLIGIVNPLAVVGEAFAPGGPTQVKFAFQQGAGVTRTTALGVAGSGSDYNASLNLADAGINSGAAYVIGRVYWIDGGSEWDASSPAVQVLVDADPPTFGAASTDKSFYSAFATPAQTAQVTVNVADIGAAGINPVSVVLGIPGTSHLYSAATIPDGGHGNYTFSVPATAADATAGDVNAVPYLIYAQDKVGNAAIFDGGAIAIDNAPPTFDTLSYDAGMWFGGDAGISIAVNIQDQTNGSGVKLDSLALAPAGVAQLTNPVANGGNRYTYATTGAALQSSGAEGPVQFNLTAQDNAGNTTTIDGGAILIDIQPPAIVSTTVFNGNTTMINGWVARENSGSQHLVVSTIIGDGTGSGTNGASLTVGLGGAQSTVNGTPADGGVRFNFNVPTNVQTAGSEAPLDVNISGTDNVGNVVGPTKTATVQIDDKGPVISNVSVVTAPADGIDDAGTKWFNQISSDDITVTAQVDDNGSGVDQNSLKLVFANNSSLRVDYGTPMAGLPPAPRNIYTFLVKRSDGPIAAGHEGLVAFKVVANDNVGNPQLADDGTHVSTGKFGIDGQAPTVSFPMPFYPPAKTNCAADIDFCGHDGNHFWRAGETNVFGFNGADSNTGSGIDTSVAGAASTCSVAGSTGTCTSSYSNGQFSFTPDFSTATFNSGSDGTGTVSVTVTVKDRAGNVGTATKSDVAVTRVKWVRKMGSSIINFAGSPIVTSVPAPQIILGGSEHDSSGAVLSLAPDGTKLWQAGHAQGITTISQNMAYSPVTKLLYVVPSGGGASAYAFPLTGASDADAGVGAGIACTGGGVSGAPTILESGGNEYALVPDDAASYHRLDAFRVSGASCSQADTLKAGGWADRVYTASTDGSNIYLGHDDTALAKATFSAAPFAFSAPIDAATFSADITGSVALATTLYIGDANATSRYRAYNAGTLAATPNWNATNAVGGSNSAAIQSPIVSSSYVFGSFEATHDGYLHAFDPSTGAAVFTYPTTPPKIGSISAIAVGADNQIYFSDSTNKEMVALRVANNAPVVSWKFTGVSGIALPNAITTEPTVDASGTIYFGDSSGDVFALITDSGGPLPPTAGTNWPRVGFDNCNSGNTSFSCE